MDEANPMETAPEVKSGPRDPWEMALERLRSRHPDATDGTLFCVHKLELDPDLSLRDFQDEARLRSIGISGRSFHAAKVLLGRAQPAKRRAKIAPVREPEKERPVARAAEPRRAKRPSTDIDRSLDGSSSLEATVLAAVQQIQADATAEATRLREAIRRAVDILSEAIAED